MKNLKSVIIEDSNNDWPVLFRKLEEILLNQLESLALTNEHVGSTSVPKLAAKPILDIDIIIDSMMDLPEVINKLSQLGYIHEGDLGIKNREAFRRQDSKVPYNTEMNEKPEHHLYVCNKESDELRRHILFRDILRKYPHLVVEYSILKKELAEKYKHNREAYTELKTEFVNNVLNNFKGF
ncbi:GrpB family protein [Paenibacillus wynnii]|uniref:GrpB family protein n=1 Tax=Paenibacillus wynnii TaxID=268407 RepID=A0A098MA56_9BACL|nr:GrpB family protein [Paenibacillus wynnii]KGE18417.1 hypothetical protein PWYN_28350 [Paenibacillus wynnii]